MKIKNLIVNRKKVASILMAMGLSIIPMRGNADLESFGMPTTLRDGREVVLHYINGETNHAVITIGNKIGYVAINDINYQYLDTNDYYQRVDGRLETTSNCFLFSMPEFDTNNVIMTINEETTVSLIAKNADGWYIVSVNGKVGFIHENYLRECPKVLVAKITGNNVNVRSDPSMTSEIIGFADITDRFEILGKTNEWYRINYLNQVGYIHQKYIQEDYIGENDLIYQSIVYLKRDSVFYQDLNGNTITILPKYQNAFVISSELDFYKVNVDGIIGYIKKGDTNTLTNTCVIIDLSRQTLRVFKNCVEVGRYHIISGRKTMQTTIGCFNIGHRLKDYQLTPTNFVRYWIQYNGNEGIHDASWQKDENFVSNANSAYNNFMRGKGVTYPSRYGSHGCDNMRECDANEVYNFVNIGDNVLVIGPNNLVSVGLISEIVHDYLLSYSQENIANLEKVKKLV